MKIAISDGEMSKSLAVGWDFSPIRKVSHKDLGEGGGRQSTPGWGHKATSNEGPEGEYRSIIMVDNPAGHSFVLWNLVSRSFSNKL